MWFIVQLVYSAGLVGIASYSLHHWAYARGVTEVNGVIKRPPKRNKETGKKQDRRVGNRVIDKWLSFGGGYYGTVAFVYFTAIEIGQILSFITDVDGMIAYFKNFGLHSIIAFFIGQLQNVFQALIWPTHYLGDHSNLELAVLFIASYAAYSSGKKVAKAGGIDWSFLGLKAE